MSDDIAVDDVEPNLATAVGLLVLTDSSLQTAAREAGVSRWELEELLRKTSLPEQLGLALDRDVTDQIDRLFEDEST